MITLETLPDATAQEVFDQVSNHLLTQNRKSKRAYLNTVDMYCVYKNSDGLECAAGCLIGDDEYNSEMERLTWNQLYENGMVPINHIALISDLQHIHDEYNPEQWEEKLTLLAEELNLNFNQK